MRSAAGSQREKTGFALIALAESALIVATFSALDRFGSDFSLFAGAMALCLLCANAGLLFYYAYFRQVRESTRRLQLLADMNIEVNRDILLNEDIELIYQTILDYLFRLFDKVATGSILILGDDGYLRFAATKGFTKEYVQNFCIKLEDSFIYQDTGGRIEKTHLMSHETLSRLVTLFEPGDWRFASVISAPLFVGDRLFGLLNLDSDVSNTFSTADAQVVEHFKSQIEVGLLARERYRTSIERHHLDALTGLFTRRHFEDLFNATLERARRYGDPFLVALFDADRLKHVNDTYGHPAGDQLLLAMARALRNSCRKSDIVGRFGGDEFIAVYFAKDAVSIAQYIENIAAALSETPTEFAGEDFRITFSYGLAHFPDQGDDLPSLIAVADRALYEMKAARRKVVSDPAS